MKSVVIYNSQTGFTKKYAAWIAEQIRCTAISYHDARTEDFSTYDIILFGSWFHAGNIQKLKWFKKIMLKYPEKKYVVFAVGASPLENPEIEKALQKNITEEYRDICNVYYCPGGINYGRMTTANRLMMKAFAGMLAGKKKKTEKERIMAEMISRDYDISDKKYIKPIIKYISEIYT